MTAHDFGLVLVAWPGPGDLACRDELCMRSNDVGELRSKVIPPGGAYYLDTVKNNRALCDQCGQCLRYARKKAHERGEPLESAEI